MARLLTLTAMLFIMVILPDIYITRSFLKECPLLVKLLQWAPTAILLVNLALMASGAIQRPSFFNLFFYIILCFVIPKFLFMAISLVGKLIAMPKAFDCIGVILSGALLVIFACGLSFGWKKVTVRNVELSFSNLPKSFDGFKIAQLSDWHLGTYTNAIPTIEKEIQTILEINPDIVTFTGDIVNLDPSEMDPFLPVLAKLSSKNGVISIMGNHDYCMYNSDKSESGMAKNVAKVQNNERSLGWNLLLNENMVISNGVDSIAFVGVENDGEPPFPQRGDLTKAQKDLPEGIFKVLLSHDPTHWKRSVLPTTDIDLTLSGHTHATQFRIGRLSPSRWFYKEWNGLYEDGDRKLYVSSGAGGNIPFRFGAWPEVVIITLRSK